MFLQVTLQFLMVLISDFPFAVILFSATDLYSKTIGIGSSNRMSRVRVPDSLNLIYIKSHRPPRCVLLKSTTTPSLMKTSHAQESSYHFLLGINKRRKKR